MCPFLNVVLVAPEIPQNTGNVGRLCLAAGARLHLVEPLGFELDEKHLRRAGLDYWDRVDMKVWSSFTALYANAGTAAKFWFFTTKVQRDYWDVDYTRGDYLVFGRETRGLPESLLAEHAENCVTIPMGKDVRSINLATAVGIGTYEALRRISTTG
ncbi:MAG: tRNA (cytidine(34)-2'-O)-methyltransferase [Verrucomicrobiales bacterium]